MSGLVNPVAATGCVRVDGVGKRFVQRGKPDTVALDACSFTVEPGRLTVLMGPSGCGKSTLAYLVAGHLEPDAGTITLDGAAVRGAGPDRMLVFQETALWPWMRIADNVMFGPLSTGAMNRAQARRAAEALLAEFGLAGFADKYPHQLSGGMRRRAEIAQALINRPRVMVLDEPFRGLDVMTRELMQEYYLQLYERTRLTTLFITSELEEAMFLADRLLFMSAAPGRIVSEMEVDLPHPRTFAAMASERYLAIKRRATAMLADIGAVETNLV
jgi:NitT/TauT family transport system ATP-binding protein